eukprot:scaffold19749_cov66-Phaeocystis_antarctica.AAC.2
MRRRGEQSAGSGEGLRMRVHKRAQSGDPRTFRSSRLPSSSSGMSFICVVIGLWSACSDGWFGVQDRPAGLAVQDRPGLAVQDPECRIDWQCTKGRLAAQVRLAAQDRLAGQDARFGEQDRGWLGLQRNSGWQDRMTAEAARLGAAVGRAVPLHARGGAAGATRQPLWACTGMPWSSLHWLVILIRAGSSEPGAPSPGAVAGFAFACISCACR